MSHLPISVVIITFNEEKNIRRCLESVQGWVDEIIVLDSFSSDQTEAICGEFGVQFFQHPFEGHIEQKNEAIKYANQPWVLSLDADEAVSPELKKSITSIHFQTENSAYNFNRLTNFCGSWIRHCGWYPDRKIRLLKKGDGHWGGQNPHDSLIINKGVELKHLKGDLLHYSFYTVNEHFKQIHFFTDISSKAAFEEGTKSSITKLFGKPSIKFIRDYIFLGGFRDGYYGLIICLNSAFAKYLKYLKILELQRKK
ncbi:MAG: glycosyltransferase involved in cell wall biosynthesis [Sphingobacteriales bacterium]|jgi:glycosyltransferase involved in cell wall biosynthesis